MENIQKNRDLIINKIKDVHKNSSFNTCETPTLIAVSKKQEDYKINDALLCGQKFFGENRVQEAMQRWESRLKIYNDLELRLIGPLQTNKVKQALKLFDVIETLDREKLAKEIKNILKPNQKNLVIFYNISFAFLQKT